MGGINNAGVLVTRCQTKTSPGTTCILTPHHMCRPLRPLAPRLPERLPAGRDVVPQRRPLPHPLMDRVDTEVTAETDDESPHRV